VLCNTILCLLSFVSQVENREVRAEQYCRLESLKSFDEFLARRFPESRRKACYLISIHEHLPQVRKDLKEVGWTKRLELAKLARRDGQHFDCATWLHKARKLPKEVQAGGGKGTHGEGNGPVGTDLLQGLYEPDSGDRAGDRVADGTLQIRAAAMVENVARRVEGWFSANSLADQT